MGFDEGHIIFNNENLTYNAGETINCMLVFDQDKKKTFRGIYAKLKGYCDVRWTTKRKKRRRTHMSHEVYIEDKKYLMGGDCDEVEIDPGHYEIPFNFSIPSDAPSSFEGSYGKVQYHVKVVVDRAFKFDQEKKIPIKVINHKDLNQDPYCKEVMEFEFEDPYCFCCISQGMCEIKARLPQSGYCPGQTMNVELSCTNRSNIKIEIILELIERRDYIASHNPGTRHDKEILSKVTKGPIPGNTTRNWMVEMQIPPADLYNLTHCNFIRIYHDFKIKVSPSSICISGKDESRRIILGHIPLREFEGPPLALPVPKNDQRES